MRIVVYGAGAVGGYFGGRLAEAGEDVVFIARGDHLQAMQTNGLKVDSIKGDFVIQPANATDDVSAAGQADMILVGVKAWQVPGVARALKSVVGPETFILPLQNGVEAPFQLAAELGEKNVLGGLCRLIAMNAGPGHIRHVGMEPSIAFGELDNRASERVQQLYRVFERAQGLTVEVSPDIPAAMWQKFIFIAAMSGIGAVTRVPVGVFRSQPGTRQMLEQTIAEICNVARARNIRLPEDSGRKTMAFIDSLPPGGTASMQRDIMNGQPSELEYQNGAVVRLGQEAGIETPLNEFIYSSLLPMELLARDELHTDA